jgi:Mg-chelatase subunit ChlD
MKVLISLVLFIIFCAGSISAQAQKQNLYGILVDNTGSMRTQLGRIKEFAKELTKEFQNKGQISVFNFQTSTTKAQTSELGTGSLWSQNQNDLEQFIDSIIAVGGQTTLCDAIFLASNLTKSAFERDKDNISEKILILITDGEDRASDIKPKELIKFVKETQIKVYAIGLVEDLSNEAGFVNVSPQAKAKEFLTKITKETNGRVVFPKSKQKPEEIVKNLFSENKKPNN